MRAAVSNHPLVDFFLLAFPLCWVSVLPLVLNPAQAPEPFLILGAIAALTVVAALVVGPIRSASSGTLLLGLLWAPWHAPGFFRGWLGGSPRTG